MSHPTEPPPAYARTTIPGNVPHVDGVYVILAGLTADYLLGGWGYLQWTGSVYHEAVDLNSMGGGDADLGALVVAPLDGEVTDVLWWDGRTAGFGNHLAVAIDDPRAAEPCYVHLAHLDTMTVAPGQRVRAGQQLGTCGKSGFQTYAHVHAALWHAVPPGGWNFWQVGCSVEWVSAHTLPPETWFWASAMKAGGTPPLSGAQRSALASAIFAPYAFNPESAIGRGWLNEWVAGEPTPAIQKAPPGSPSCRESPTSFVGVFSAAAIIARGTQVGPVPR